MNQKFINLLLFYLIKLDQLGVRPVEMQASHPDPMRRLGHCMWMITKMRSFDWDSDEIKANRWLGYIQGVLNAERIFTILELRDHTRPLYNDIPECDEVLACRSEHSDVSVLRHHGVIIDFRDITRPTKEFVSFHTYFNKGLVSKTQTEVIFYFKEALKASMTAPSARRSEHNELITESLKRMSNTKFLKMDVDAVKKEIFETAEEELSHPSLGG